MILKRKTTLLSMLVFLLLLSSSITVYADIHPQHTTHVTTDVGAICLTDITSDFTDLPSAVTVSDASPFYTLIATPLTIHYDEVGTQSVIPLYVKNLDEPSKAIEQTEAEIGIYTDFVIGLFPPKETSLKVADIFWDSASAALLIEESSEGYNLGIVAVPLASYLSIPVIITDELDDTVMDVLTDLGVDDIFICGNLEIPRASGISVTRFTAVDDIINLCIDVIADRFDQNVDYITMANPLDIAPPTVLDSTVYEFSGTVSSELILPTQLLTMTLKQDAMAVHEFTIPEDYKYAEVRLNLINPQPEYAETLGDRVNVMVTNTAGDRYVFGGTHGGLPERDSMGNVIQDQLQFEITIYDEPGTYTATVFGQFFEAKSGDYDLTVTVEKLDSPLVPLMPGISSMAPYLTAYHKGIVLAKPEFAFAADDTVMYNGSTCPGVTQPGTNPNLIVPSNEHTMVIHDELNTLLAQLAGDIPIDEDLEALTTYYKDNPMYIAIAADPTMVPMYFYKNPDGLPGTPSHTMGFAVPSDFIYGDIDPIPSDPENNTYTYWPFMENIVGRVTGYDVQDCSALIARTIFYNDIINRMDSWKDNALVQTGCGLEFQNLPIVTRLGKLIGSITGTGRDEPTKWPTGESTFMNMKLTATMELGYTNVHNTFWLQSQREGFTDDELQLIKDSGLLNHLLFPKNVIDMISGEDKVTGGQDQLNSNLIFSFAHGFYNLYESGDILLDARGFPFISPLSRIYPRIRTSLSNKGTYDIRSISNTEYGPSVIFIESCITGRTDGFMATNCLSQTYLHAGVNAYIGSTRVTADPGYLDPRPLPGGWGVGLLGFVKALLNYRLKGEYPDAHFGAVIAENLILSLIQEDATIGMALRDAKNAYLPQDANTTFLWSPPLTLNSGSDLIDQEYLNALGYNSEALNGRTRVLDKKYVALHEFTLYGDPAFNPYQSVNEG
jgi:hypothetical protein